jgi:hypothetical protein
MTLVLDSSVVINWVLPEQDTPTAVRLRNEFRRGMHDLIAPDIFRGQPPQIPSPARQRHYVLEQHRQKPPRDPLFRVNMQSVIRSAATCALAQVDLSMVKPYDLDF